MKTKKKYYKRKIVFCILLIFLLLLILRAIFIAKNINYGNFIYSEAESGLTKFSRDYIDTYEGNIAYVIDNEVVNDAMISKKIKVEKNTPYRLSCYVKCENVTADSTKKGIGAHLSILNSAQTSKVISGTTSWEYIELMFNSEDKEEIEIGARLGGNNGNAKGVAKFSNFVLEKGTKQQSSNTWNIAYFLFDTTNISQEGKVINETVSDEEKETLKDTIARFEESTQLLSNGKLKITNNLYEVDAPLTSVSFDESYGYYIDTSDIDTQISQICSKNQFDHIFIIAKLGDINESFSGLVDYLGLSGIDYYGVSLSNIRIPNEDYLSYYKYSQETNTFPEEIFLHEFLHSFEQKAKSLGYDIPDLHDNLEYGYKTEKLIGTQHWLWAYMNCQIQTQDGLTGLPEEIFYIKPVGINDFEQTKVLDNFEEVAQFKEYVIYILERMFIFK